MRAHENLEVWKKAIDFVVEVYTHTDKFPSDERFGLTSQLRRAAVSIPANIAEGAARATNKDKLRFLSISQGSTSEVETELVVSQRLGYITQEELTNLLQKTEELARMMYGWARHLRANGDAS